MREEHKSCVVIIMTTQTLISLMVSVDVKHHVYFLLMTSQGTERTFNSSGFSAEET